MLVGGRFRAHVLGVQGLGMQLLIHLCHWPSLSSNAVSVLDERGAGAWVCMGWVTTVFVYMLERECIDTGCVGDGRASGQ